MPSTLRVIFAGTPQFAATVLRAIHDAGLSVPLVLTQPDRAAGRGMKFLSSPVKELAIAKQLTLVQPPSLRCNGKYPTEAADTLALLHATPHDVIVVAAYGLLLPQAVLDIAPYGCINIHASLLPRWRGAAPIHRAIEAGDRITGVTLIQMDEGLDMGPMLMREAVAIAPTDTTGTLHDKLANTGARLIVAGLRKLERTGLLTMTPQPIEGVTYAHKLSKQEAALDWRLPADVLACKVRTFNPFPVAHGILDGTPLKIWAAEPVCVSGSNLTPGTILSVDNTSVTIACGKHALRATQLQKPGGKRLFAREFVTGFPLFIGQCFETKRNNPS
ncbi:methionyl-tRNA formyltransferase [Candidatus Vallotia cooleyia]|uniref:methionyl-tRNA formyltransferase n=1 Tax=Candidatus Vallotiella adelgis TaxID=1177211 RepID=UPI001D035BAC|nr:methionyl-tRNA formyltransferase [Candidatus Vallotia cooleyia]UDG82606.1 Methionyl-tRNA formyltransferase [Candidatus Vallotia cooleyia]